MSVKSIRLYELNSIVRTVVRENVKPSYWVTGEISELKVNASGHCYLELVEKDEKKSCLIAKAKATIWSSVFRMIKPYFETSTGTSLSAGIKVLVRVTVEFHELYGFNLNIIDIEPSFTVGEMARKKREIINRLVTEGVFDMNKDLFFPRPANRIAIVSSATAAGFGDFIDQLTQNPFGYRFYLKLFPAYMQGDGAEQSIIKALEKIHTNLQHFDVVVIIRGGGSQADLDCYNNYWLSLHIAQFPVPVLTGIGHEQDECVADMVAHSRLKTPTAVAEFLIDRMHDEESLLGELGNEIAEITREVTSKERDKLRKLVQLLSNQSNQLIHEKKILQEKLKFSVNNSSLSVIKHKRNAMENLSREIQNGYRKIVIKEEQKLFFRKDLLRKLIKNSLGKLSLQISLLENKSHYLDPSEILKRGYTITRRNKVRLHSAGMLQKGDRIETVFYDGTVHSEVISKKLENE